MNGQRGVSGVSAIRAHCAVAGAERVRSLLRWLRLTSGAQQEIAALDGLRALAVLLVVGYHVQEVGAGDWPLQRLPFVTGMFDFGFIGVLLFFVLSGFLLFLPYARALVGRRPWPSPIQFYRRRVLRIVPLYYAVLAIAGAGAAVTGELRGWVIKGLALDFLFLQNLNPSAGHLNGALDPSLWTLAIEWQFYLLLPWLALGIARLCRPTPQRSDNGRTVMRAALAVSGLFACGLGLRILAALAFYGDAARMPQLSQNWLSVGLRVLGNHYLEDFALGMLLSLLYALALERGWFMRRPIVRLGGGVAVAAVLGLAVCYQWAWWQDVFHAPSPWQFLPAAGWSWVVFGEWTTTGCFALLVGGVLLGPAVLRRVFCVAPLRWIGVISYSVYIWHMPVILFVRNTGAALTTILLLSLASYYLVERPFLRRRYSSRASASARGSKSVPAPPASASPAHVG